MIVNLHTNEFCKAKTDKGCNTNFVKPIFVELPRFLHILLNAIDHFQVKKLKIILEITYHKNLIFPNSIMR